MTHLLKRRTKKEPVIEFSGASITLTELLLAALLVLGAVVITVWAVRSRKISSRAKRIGTVDFDTEHLEDELPILQLVSDGES